MFYVIPDFLNTGVVWFELPRGQRSHEGIPVHEHRLALLGVVKLHLQTKEISLILEVRGDPGDDSLGCQSHTEIPGYLLVLCTKPWQSSYISTGEASVGAWISMGEELGMRKPGATARPSFLSQVEQILWRKNWE